MNYDSPSQDVEEIIRLKVELAKNKFRMAEVERLTCANNDLNSRLILAMTENQEFFLRLQNCQQKLCELARSLHIKIDSSPTCENCIGGKNMREKPLKAESNFEEFLLNSITQRMVFLMQERAEMENKIRQIEQFNRQIPLLNQLIERYLSQINELEGVCFQKETETAGLRRRIQEMGLIERERTEKENIPKRLSEQVMKNCEQILRSLQIGEEEYLQSYIMKSLQVEGNSPSRKTKYDFVFE